MAEAHADGVRAEGLDHVDVGSDAVEFLASIRGPHGAVFGALIVEVPSGSRESGVFRS